MKNMKRMTRRASLAAAAAALAVAMAGCSPGLFDVAQPAASGGRVVLTEHVTPSALVAVPAPGTADETLVQVIGATARPLEHLDIVPAGNGTHALVASSSPAPAVVRIPARPVPPPSGATSYQEAVYQKNLAHWDGELATGQRTVASQTAAATDIWVRGQLAMTGSAGASAAGGSLAAEGGLAGSVLSAWWTRRERGSADASSCWR